MMRIVHALNYSLVKFGIHDLANNLFRTKNTSENISTLQEIFVIYFQRMTTNRDQANFIFKLWQQAVL
jgi:hypothetical protein